jgi:hypothetical protein
MPRYYFCWRINSGFYEINAMIETRRKARYCYSMNEARPENRDLRNSRLRLLIGARARYHGVVYEILEVIEDEPALVLQDENHSTIQADQHGEAHRRVPSTVTVKLPLTSSGAVDLAAMDIELLDASLEEAGLIAD